RQIKGPITGITYPADEINRIKVRRGSEDGALFRRGRIHLRSLDNLERQRTVSVLHPERPSAWLSSIPHYTTDAQGSVEAGQKKADLFVLWRVLEPSRGYNRELLPRKGPDLTEQHGVHLPSSQSFQVRADLLL